ncbi:MAG: glycosyltransferase [Nitrospirae bacterium]|nr:glycosyltransferase [Nitrospirota bacterium]
MDKKISIIIPTFNSAGKLIRCLESFKTQTINNKEYEILVVDDGSNDKTKEAVTNYPIRYIYQKNRGPASARNNGAIQAEGNIILFTDADCEPQPNWIEEMIKPFNNPEVIGVKGAYKTRQKELIARLVQVEYEHKYERMKKFKYIDFIDTYSAGYLKNIFLKYNGFDERYPKASVEDQEFSFRLSQDGHKMVFNPDAIVFHEHSDNIIDYLKKKYKIAFWKAFLLKRHPNKIKTDTHTPQSLKIQMVLSLLVLLGVTAPVYQPMYYVSALSLLMFLLSCIPFVLFALKRDQTVALISPVILFLRSLALSLGLSVGMVKHLRR